MGQAVLERRHLVLDLLAVLRFDYARSMDKLKQQDEILAEFSTLDVSVLVCAWKSNLRGRLSTVDLLILTSLDPLIFILNLFYKTRYLNEEVNSSEPSPQLVFLGLSHVIALMTNSA